MGATLTTMILLVGSIVDGVMSSITADRARKKQWTQAKIFAGVSLGIALGLLFLSLYMVIKHHMLSGPGVMIAMIFLILSTIGAIVLDAIAFAGTLSDKPEDSRAFGMAVGSSILSFGSFIISLVIIVFLL
jgi:hypothetical protein